jgi:hypothetical protein
VPLTIRTAVLVTGLAMGLAIGLAVTQASAQTGNLDAGKSPAQIFSTTCSGCHRNAREVRRASASFLRSHYTTGREEASAMASYLSGLPADPRGDSKSDQRSDQKSDPKRTATPAPGQPRREPGEQAKSGAQTPGQTRPFGKGQAGQTAAARQRQQQLDAEEHKQPAPVHAPAPAPVELPETSGSPAPAVLPPMEE